jgi:hypothetical protein
MKNLREYIDLIELLLERNWWPAKKPSNKSSDQIKGPQLVGTMSSAAKATKPVTMMQGFSDPMHQLHMMQVTPKDVDLGAVDHLAAGLLKTLPTFEADPNVKKNLEMLLKTILDASENGNDQLVKQTIAKLYAQFESLMKTGQYDEPSK